jgi:hypothetical protein
LFEQKEEEDQGRSYSVGPVSVDTDDLGANPFTCSPIWKNDPSKKQIDPDPEHSFMDK